MGSDKIELRLAKLSDSKALFQLENDCFTQDKMSFRSFQHLLKVDSAKFVVALVNGVLVASTLLFFRKNSKIARVYSLAVHPNSRKLGLASKLFDQIESVAKKYGKTELRLEVKEDNLPAIALYEKKGYNKFGKKPAYYEDGSNAILYKKSL